MTIDQEETWGGLTEFEAGPLKHTLKYSKTVEKKNQQNILILVLQLIAY